MPSALVTGGAGFVGSHLCELLLQRGYDVVVIDNLSTGRYANIAALEPDARFRLYVDTVMNATLTEQLVRDADEVYHLASAVGVELIVSRPVHTIESIFGTTELILRFCNRYRKPCLITSTSEVYGKSTAVPFRETDDTVSGPTARRRWAYACAKALDEFLALAYFTESQLPVRIARLFNTVGPRQVGQYGMVVPRFIAAAKRNEPLRVFGDGTQSRCFGHVADVVQGLVGLMQVPASAGEVVNLGNEEELTIRQFADLVIETLQSKSTVEYVRYEDAYGPGFEDMQRRVPCLDKARRLIGFEPQRSVRQIILDTAAAMPSGA